ncbi:MAG: hypothetical protein IJI19_08200, partial [Ruminococcus sp.]|nr:hypothetical protein [Ruminococcus sp.]
MRKCKQVISLILVLTMMFAILSVGIVQGAAADTNSNYKDPPHEPALLGDVNRDGKINGNDVYVLKNSIARNYSKGYINYNEISVDSIDFKVADCYKDEEVGLQKKIDGKDVFLLQQYIAHVSEARDKGIGEPVYPDPTTATITIYGLNGQSETKEFNVGETFDVYTSLNVKKSGNDIQIASASGDQNFTDSVLALTSAIDDEQLFTDSNTVFPVFGDQAMGRLRGAGWVQYNASTPSMTNAFVFDSDDDLMIVTKYTVTKGGTGEVRNALSYLAAADENITKLVTKGVVAPDVELTVNATFEKPVAPAEPTVAPAPTEAPTEAPKPTEAPTEAPKPTEAPTEAPKPTEAPTEAPKPTEAPTEAPKPTEAPTEAPKPTVAPTDVPKPTVAPTEAPTQPQGKATVTVRGLDGASETKEFNVGDTFTVYTTLNASAYNGGGLGTINGRQLYTNAVLELADAIDPDTGDILDVTGAFPITGMSTISNGQWNDLSKLWEDE